MQFYKLFILTEFKKLFDDKEKVIISLFIFLVLITHSIVSLFHFHECDSSDVYKYLTDSSIFSRGHFIGHISKTGSIFAPLRILFALTISIIPFDFIRSSILLPLKMTYPPIEGFFYGLYLPDRFGLFYEYSAFINIIFFIFGVLIFYKSLKFVGISKFISFLCSFGMLSFYSINSYTYHLGSTIWFISGSLISITATIFFHNKLSKYGFSLALITSYPSIIHFLAHNIYLYIKRAFTKKLISKNKKKNILINKLLLVIRSNKIGFLTFIFIILFFFPFNSGNRIDFDYRGFFTPFAFLPQYSKISIFTLITSILLFVLCFYTIYKRLVNNIKISISYKKSKSLNFAIDISIINLTLITFLISIGQLSFGLTRHSLFITPYIFFLVAVALQLIYLDLKNYFFRAFLIKKLLSITLFTFLMVLSIYSSYFRFDPLKTDEIPLNIREFVAKNNNNTISLIDCDTHYLYNDFSEIRATYNKKDPQTYVPINFIGTRLLITQSIRGIENFSLDLKKGDELITKYKDVKVTLVEEPYFKEKNIFFESMNFNKNSSLYAQRDNPFSRSNSIYIFPIKVVPFNQELLS